MSIQINLANLTDCGYLATSDLAFHADAATVNAESYIFKERESVYRLEGFGYFDNKNSYFSKSDSDFIENVYSSSVVIATTNDETQVSARIYKNLANNGFAAHQVLILLSEKLFEQIRNANSKGNIIQIRLQNTTYEDVDHCDKVAKCEIQQILLLNNSKGFDSALVDTQIDDIKRYLKQKLCVNSHGQVTDICNELAESFRDVPKSVNKFDLLDEINSLIASFRSSFHTHINSNDEEKLRLLNEKYGFLIRSYSENKNDEFNEILDEKERYEAIKIYNHLWSSTKVANIFKNGFPFGCDETQSLADEYLRLQHVHSKTCEKILFDVLIVSQIGNYANNLQLHNLISSAALLSIPVGFYKADSLVVTNERGYFSKSKLGGLIFGQFFGLLIGGGFSWGVSGWISGSNETARIILFGSLFSAYLILVGLLHQNEKVDFSKEEHYFSVVRNMCNLHSLSNSLDVKLMRHMINELSMSGVLFQHQMLHLVSSIESRK